MIALLLAQTIAITGGTVYPVSGPKVADASVLIHDGRIVAVGTNVAIPSGATRIDAKGKWVTPGLIDGAGQLGLVEISVVPATREGSVQGDTIAAAFNVAEGINPASTLIPVTRIEGITTALAVPSGNLVSGQAVLIDLDGVTIEVDQDRLTAHEVARGHRQRRGDPFDSGDGDQRGGGVDPLRHVEGGGDGIPLNAALPRRGHDADLHQAELTGSVDEPRRHPLSLGVDAGRARGNRHVGPHRDNPAVADQHVRVGDLRTGDGIHRSTRDGDGLGKEQGDHRSLPGAGIWPSSKSVRGWCAGSARS